MLVPWTDVTIGDATHGCSGFRLFPNHARILTSTARLGFVVLPDILWHKPTSSPTKFMAPACSLPERM